MQQDLSTEWKKKASSAKPTTWANAKYSCAKRGSFAAALFAPLVVNASEVAVNATLDEHVRKTIAVENVVKCSEQEADVLSPKAEHYQKSRRPNYSHMVSNYPAGVSCRGELCKLSINVTKDKGDEIAYLDASAGLCELKKTSRATAQTITTYHAAVTLSEDVLIQKGMSADDIKKLGPMKSLHGKVTSVSKRKGDVTFYVGYDAKSLTQYQGALKKPANDLIGLGAVNLKVHYE